MKPCDVKDRIDYSKLDHVGYCHNDESITLEHSNKVVLRTGQCSMGFSVHRFKQFINWFLEEQESEVL